MTTTRLFSVTDPLPTGTTVLEASAGTGKTYAIAALAARYLAEGVARVDDLLLITFSRAATAELRSRVRERLRDTALALGSGGGATASDPVVVALAEGTDEEVAERAARLRDAFAHFDRATIMTTHEFCHGMLAGLGVLAPQTPQSTLVEDLRPLASEAAEDVFVRLFADRPHGAPFAFGKQWDAEPGAQEIAERAVTEVADLVGLGSPGPAGDRVAFASAVRFEVARRKHARRLYSFDDMLQRLDDALRDPETGARARARLAERFPCVLVDEFQDTDPVQWSVLRHAFHDASTLVLIGDPKQAIYGFRGGDVHTYSRAVAEASERTTLGHNFRSDPEVVEGVGTLFAGIELGDGIVAPPVHAAQPSRLTGVDGTPWTRGVQLRVVDPERCEAPHRARRAILEDLVGVVGSLLSDAPPLTRAGEPLRPRDIAVLVRANRSGHETATALNAAGIPATFTGSHSVFDTRAARDWVTLLRALEQPRRPYLQRAFLTDFVGATFDDLALADESRRAAWSLSIHTWARVLERSGVPALVAAIERDTDLTARLLASRHGERRLTDLRHLAELLHLRAAGGHGARPHDLAAWLSEQGPDAQGAAVTARRDTDDEAVTVMTVHRAKGLQWPVVLLPEVSQQRSQARDHGGTLVLPEGDHRLLDVAGRRTPARAERWERWRDEEGDEALRALYVGLTRAQSRVVAWWAHHEQTESSPLHRVLHASHDRLSPRRPAASYPVDGPGHGSPLHAGWLAGTQVAVVAADATPTRPARRTTSLQPGDLLARNFDRTIDQQWRRTSYSGLTAAVHDLPPVVESVLVSDEAVPDVDVTPDPAWSQRSPMAELPAGAAFGTLVHAVYEHTDATGEGWEVRVARAVDEALRRWPLAGVGADALTEALLPTFTTPLGPLAPGVTLRSFPPADRLSEMDFEFALENPRATIADIASLLAEHLAPDDPLAAYPERLRHPALADQVLHGFLTGSIDSVLRLDGHADRGGFLVVDYKTNRLSAPEEDLTLGHYTPDALADAMMASHYPLQALLYCVALHRFLRLRLAGYDPETHLAGVAYLFVRGMAGADTPHVGGHPLGVFSWRPPAALVVAVSRLLAGPAHGGAA